MAEENVVPMANTVFQNGTMWLPVIGLGGENQTIEPWMRKAEFGSLRPVIELEIPLDSGGTFTSNSIPYENIVSFEHSVQEMTFKLSFVDSTPVFAEQLLREYYNRIYKGESLETNKKTTEPKNNSERYQQAKTAAIRQNFSFPTMQARYGWAIQNLPPPPAPQENNQGVVDAYNALREKVNNDGKYLTDRIGLYVISSSYKYTNFGVLVDIDGTVFSKAALSGIPVEPGQDGGIPPSKLNSIETLADFLTTKINESCKKIGNLPTYRVVFAQGMDNVKLNAVKEVKVDGATTIDTWLYQISSAIALPEKVSKTGQLTGEKTSPKGVVELWFDQTPRSYKGKDEYWIIFYNPESIPQGSFKAPKIVYPAQDSPIVQFNPSADAHSEYLYLAGQNLYSTDEQGNRKKVTRANDPPIQAGVNAPTTGVTTSTSSDIPEAFVSAARRQSRFLVNLGIEMLGDPMFTDINMINTIWYVKNNIILQDGLVRNNQSFWENFIGYPLPDNSPLKNKRQEDAIPESPYDGKYILLDITNKINAQSGFTTEINLMWAVDILLDSSSSTGSK